MREGIRNSQRTHDSANLLESYQKSWRELGYEIFQGTYHTDYKGNISKFPRSAEVVKVKVRKT